MSRLEGNAEVRDFIRKMEAAMAATGAPPVADHVAFLRFQRNQVERLFELETAFRERLIRHRQGRAVYRKFMKRATDGSVLSARPFFRARQKTFTKQIGPAIVRGDVESVQKHRVNYRFVRWALKQAKLGKRFQVIADQIAQQRKDIMVMLLPLALNRVAIFWRRTSRSHLGYLDLMDIAVEGALSGIDKFCPPFKRVFRAVVIGRMISNLIDRFSDTMVHFYPGDRRVLYRANKLAGRQPTPLDHEDYELLAGKVQKDGDDKAAVRAQQKGMPAPAPGKEVAPHALASMMAASRCVSIDTGPAAVGRSVRRLSAPEEEAPDVVAEAREALQRVGEAMDVLCWRAIKVLRMLGYLSLDGVLDFG